MPTIEQVKSQISRFRRAKSILPMYEVNELPQILSDNETIQFITKGHYEGNEGVIIATESRVVYVCSGLESVAIKSFSYDTIENVHYAHQELYSVVELFFNQEKFEFTHLTVDDALLLSDFLSNQLGKKRYLEESVSENFDSVDEPKNPSHNEDASKKRWFAFLNKK